MRCGVWVVGYGVKAVACVVQRAEYFGQGIRSSSSAAWLSGGCAAANRLLLLSVVWCIGVVYGEPLIGGMAHWGGSLGVAHWGRGVVSVRCTRNGSLGGWLIGDVVWCRCG
eukprot:352234-Chlamydomonas_euryale.AAC.1